MTKTRLTKTHRAKLMHFAKEKINVPETKAREAAYLQAAIMVSEDIKKVFPAKDTDVLRRYKVAKRAALIKGCSPEGQFIDFTFEYTCDQAPWAPDLYNALWSLKLRKATVSAIEKFKTAQYAEEKKISEKLDAYNALVQSAKTFEDVVDVWAGAEALRGKICAQKTALSALSKDQISFIKADNAGAGDK